MIPLDSILKRANLESVTYTLAEGSLFEGQINGVTYDENWNLREHRRDRGDGCYLITALTKAKLLSIGQVYQLRKLMLNV